MSEAPQAQQPQNKDIEPSIDKAMPYPVDSVHGLVQRNEAAFALGRFDKSEKGAQGGEVSVVKDAENLLKVLAVELGLNQDSKELRMLGKFLREKGAAEAFQEIAGREMIGKSKEEQAEFMSAGIDSLKEMVSGLMDIREQAKGIRELETEVDELWGEYLNSTKEEKKAIHSAIEKRDRSRKTLFEKTDHLYKDQHDLDRANEFKSKVDVYKSSTDKTKYNFSMSGTPVSKFMAFLYDSPGLIWRKVSGMPFRSAENMEARLSDLSVELRAEVLSSGDNASILEMWRNGVLSTNELGSLRAKLVSDLGQDSMTDPLTEEEINALDENKELKKFLNEDGSFTKADRNVQATHFQKFFQQKQALSLEQYKMAQDEYLGFDFSTAEGWKKALGAASLDLDFLTPQFIQKWAIPLGNDIGKGILTFGKDIGKEVGFVIDNMEGMIANKALEDLSSSAVAREMAVENLLKLLNSPEEVDPKEVAKAAEVLRGAESALIRAAMMVARATDTVSITQDKGLALSTILSPVELASAGLDAATGGIMFRKNVGELLKELRARTEKLLDGKGALNDAADLLKEMKEKEKMALLDKVVSAEDSRMADKVSKAKIPEQYMDRDSMDQHVNRSVFSRIAEKLIKFVGPETKLAKNSQAWKILTEGSKRQSVDEVVEATDNNRKKAAIGAELVKEKLLAAEAGVERSMLAVQEATLIAYKQAQDKFTDMELRQISERSKLDKMWESVTALGAAAVGLAVAFGAAAGLESVASGWVSAAEASMGKALGELSKMREGAAEIAKLAQQYGLPSAEVGAQSDVLFQQAEVGAKGINWLLSEFVQNTAPGAKDLLGKVIVSLPFLAAGRASWNLMPGNRALSSFMKADKIEDVNVV